METKQTAAERLIQHEESTGFFADLRDIPPEQFEAFMEGLASFYDAWRKAGFQYTHILFFTIVLFGKIFEKVPDDVLTRAITHLIALQRIVDKEDLQELAGDIKAIKNRERKGWFAEVMNGYRRK